MAEKRKEKDPFRRDRTTSVPVVSKNPEEYQRVAATVKAFRSMLERLSAENMLLLRATAKTGPDRMLPRQKDKKALAALFYGAGNSGKKTNYELRTRFFELWKEYQEKDKRLGELGSWVWDSAFGKLTPTLAMDLWKRIDGCNPQRFRSFGLPSMHCASRDGFCEILVDEETEDILVSFKVFKDGPPFTLVAQGLWRKKEGGEPLHKELNPGSVSLLRRFASHQKGKEGLPWSDPRLRLDKKGRLFLDLAYQKPPWRPRADAVAGRVFEVSLRPGWLKIKDRNLEREVPLGCEGHVTENGVVPPDGKFKWKGLRCAAEVARLAQHEKEKERRKEMEASARSNRDHRTIRNLSGPAARAAKRRSAYVRQQCHVWAKEIAGQAKRFNCSAILVRIPHNKKAGKNGKPAYSKACPSLHGYQWQWDTLKNCIVSAGQDAGIPASEGMEIVNLLDADSVMEETGMEKGDGDDER